MTREEFGQLVAALRDELGWTQLELSESADLDVTTISNIERGTKKQLDQDLLLRLSKALQMTVGERRQFFQAASGLDNALLMSRVDGYERPQAIDSAQVLEELVRLLSSLRVPCLLVDGYQEILALNAVTLELFKTIRDRTLSWSGLPGGFTTMMSVFTLLSSPEAPVSGNWETSAIANMRLFRERSLPYRAKPYFKYLMREFRNTRKYPDFQRYWRLAGTLPEEESSSLQLYAHLHPALGELKYYVMPAVTTTIDGDLYLCQLAPADQNTAEAFRQVAQRAESRAVRFGTWPEKTMHS